MTIPPDRPSPEQQALLDAMLKVCRERASILVSGPALRHALVGTPSHDHRPLIESCLGRYIEKAPGTDENYLFTFRGLISCSHGGPKRILVALLACLHQEYARLVQTFGERIAWSSLIRAGAEESDRDIALQFAHISRMVSSLSPRDRDGESHFTLQLATIDIEALCRQPPNAADCVLWHEGRWPRQPLLVGAAPTAQPPASHVQGDGPMPISNDHASLAAAIVAAVLFTVYMAWLLYGHASRAMILPPCFAIVFIIVWSRRASAFYRSTTTTLLALAAASSAVPSATFMLRARDARLDAKIVGPSALFAVVCVFGAVAFGVLELRRAERGHMNQPPSAPRSALGGARSLSPWIVVVVVLALLASVAMWWLVPTGQATPSDLRDAGGPPPSCQERVRVLNPPPNGFRGPVLARPVSVAEYELKRTSCANAGDAAGSQFYEALSSDAVAFCEWLGGRLPTAAELRELKKGEVPVEREWVIDLQHGAVMMYNYGKNAMFQQRSESRFAFRCFFGE